MPLSIARDTADAPHPLRLQYLSESPWQLVHDSIHRRPGWVESYVLRSGEADIGFATIAVGGPWTAKPTILEWYIAPAHRTDAFALFDLLQSNSAATCFEVQSSDTLLTTMLHVYGENVQSEKIVFGDHTSTALMIPNAVVTALTPDEELRQCIERQSGGGEWHLHVDGKPVGSGGILFHYNRPYADVYMEILEPFRRRGYGAFLVQALKRECYRLGCVPAARCDTVNVASRRTLQRAGFVPFAQILTAAIRTA